MRTRLHDLLEVMKRRRGDAPAVTDQVSTLTYAALWREVRAVAAGLHAFGLRRGDRVGVWLDKRVETVTAIFGASAAGGVFVPVNPLFRPRQVRHVLADCSAQLLVTSAERWTALRGELAGCRSLVAVVLVDGRDDRHDGQYRITGWESLLTGGGDADAAAQVIDADVAAILYTSGSTGPPKGVVLSHRNLVAGAQSVVSYLGNHPGDVILVVLQLSFDAGLSQLTTGFWVGAHVVLANYLLPHGVVRLCATHQVTGITGVPPLWTRLAEQRWPPEAARSLRYFASTGGRMPRATLERLRLLFPGAAPYLMFGLTEAFRSTYLDPAEVDRRPDSMGKAIPNAEILVMRPDGSECGPGEPGELVHRGATVALGYWNDPGLTATRFRPAPRRLAETVLGEVVVWSGDTVVRDEEGLLYFVGPTDEMIKTSGCRVSPTEVEEAAYATGLVREAVALGRDDRRLGQRVVLVVTPVDGGLDPQRLRAELRRRLPRYVGPHDVVVRSALPRSPNGKYDRILIREEL